ncbi:hypothetical protein [uncultured Tateyamaria sp.]|uniref:hypothetical protein n=1 Tax=uncultured Tateyamaria sp. TaxID=455651 RepID=UPI0026104241|nr:hypothetical protein [uncultured Tateyamaria sp.]
MLTFQWTETIRLHILPLLLTALLAGTGAMAGAWLQEHRKGFLSYSSVYEESGRLDGSLFIEYGLRPKLTLGAKVDVDMTSGRLGNGTAFVFLRKPIPTGEREYKLAYEIGVGSTFGIAMDPLLRTGLSYGKGIKVWEKYGWLAVDGAVEWAIDDGPNTLKIDSTFGLTLNDRFKVMMQVFVSSADGDVSTTLAPSLIWQPKKPKAPSIVVGIEGEEGVLALKFGMWQSF